MRISHIKKSQLLDLQKHIAWNYKNTDLNILLKYSPISTRVSFSFSITKHKILILRTVGVC